MASLLGPEDLQRIEQQYADGLPARAIVGIFQPLGVRLSEATFRKYVQVGLLPRSRRVGRKGKHRGSQGLYPGGAVRRINLIKKMMAEGLTLEEIRGSFLWFRSDIEELERVLNGIVSKQLEEAGTRGFPKEVRRELERAVGEAQQEGKRLVRQLERIASQLVAGGHDDEASGAVIEGLPTPPVRG